VTEIFPGAGPIEPEDVPPALPAAEPEATGFEAEAEAPEVAASPEWEQPPAHAGSPQPHAHGDATGASPASRPIAPKEYYSISEVCDLVGLKPHVLRYWESQFPVLNPSKNRSGNRVYQRKEIKLILLVQHLLYKEKYTIEGARQRLDALRRGGKSGELAQAASQALDAEMTQLLKDELQQLLEVLTPSTRGGRRSAPAAEGPARASHGQAAE